MPCAFGLDPYDCSLEHWCPRLGGRRENTSWRAPCPNCRGERALAWWAQGRSVRWKCYGDDCDRLAAHAALAAIVGDCISAAGRPREETFTRSDFVLMVGLSPAALQLTVAAIAWNVTPKQAAVKLGMSRSTYYRVVSEVPDLGRNRRSA